MTPDFQRKSPAPHGAGTGPEIVGKRSGPNISTARRLPPYARHITEAQRAGRHPNVYLFAGSDAWNQAEHRRWTHGEGSALVLPPGDEPEDFRWPALDALVLVPGDAEGDVVRRLVICLLIAGCRCIVEIRPDRQPIAHYGTAGRVAA